MSLSNAEKLRRFFDQFQADDHVLITIFADPDSMASAMAVKRLLWRRVANVAITNINMIERPDNLSMVRLLGISLTYINDLDKSPFNRFVIVDSQPGHNEAFDKFSFDVIIDHHPETDASAPFMDIRPNYGATSSIMTEYLRAAKIKPSAKLATGLFYAIKTDTGNFEREARIEDLRAFQFLFRHANMHIVRKFELADLLPGYLKYFKLALKNMRTRRDRMYVHLGSVINPDVCVIIADFFLRINTVNWSIVSGIYETKLIVIFRNDGLRKNAGKIAEKSFSHLGNAGGHKSMARAEIPLSGIKNMADHKDDNRLLKWIINQIEKKA